MKRSAVLLMAAVCVCAPLPLLAQDGKLTISVAAMAVGPLSGSARQFTTGIGVDVGATWHFTDQLGLRFDYVQAALGTRDAPQFPATVPVSVKPRLRFGSASIVFRAPVEKVRIHVTGGVGLYHRSVRLTTAATGPISVCNPWWFVCFPGPVTADRVSAARSTTNLGVHVGAGFSVSRYYVEMQYHYVWGPTFATAAGRVPATGKFLPLVVGMRF